MESSNPSSESLTELDVIQKWLGTEGVIIDPKHKDSVLLKETQAHRRKELVGDIEYDFSLALNHGDYFLGRAQIKFELLAIPENDEELFINS